MTIDEYGKSRTVYGIELPDVNISIKDVFCKKEEAETFIEKCNRLDLSPIHLYDVIDDSL